MVLVLRSVSIPRYWDSTGSNTANCDPDPQLVDPLSAIQQRAAQDLTLVDWSLSPNLTFAGVVAQRGTVCIPFVTSFAGEGVDRNTTLDNNGDEMVLTVAANCDNTIAVVQSVGPVNMEVCRAISASCSSLHCTDKAFASNG